MKKFIIPLLTVVMVVSIILAGCVPATPPEGPETSEPPSGPAEQPPEEQEPPEAPPEAPPEVTLPEEEAPPTPSKPHFTSDDGRIEFALDSIERTKVWPAEVGLAELEGSVPKEGYDFIIVNVIIVRVTDGHIDKCSGSTLTDNKGGEYSGYGGLQSYWTTSWLVPYDRYELLERSKGKYIYEAPENVEPVKLRLVYLFFKSWSESGQRNFEEERYIDIILS
jgi:hypothetical protein